MIFARLPKNLSDRVKEEQGSLFSYAAYRGEDMDIFAEEYMHSDIRFVLDMGAGGYIDYTGPEIYRRFTKKEFTSGLLKRNEKFYWIGKIYQEMQWGSYLLSRDIVSMFPISLMEGEYIKSKNKDDWQVAKELLAGANFNYVEWDEDRWKQERKFVVKLERDFANLVGNELVNVS